MNSLDNVITWSQMNVEPFTFFLLAILILPLAFGVIFDRSIIRAGFVLIGVFGGIAGLFILLQAQFLAMAQIMIYAVGITLVVVIALMLTNPRMEDEETPSLPANRASGVVMAVLFFLTIFLAIRSNIWHVSTEPVSPDVTLVLGGLLTTLYSLPFEFSSILLLAALIGAVMLAKAEPEPDEREETISQRTLVGTSK